MSTHPERGPPTATVAGGDAMPTTRLSLRRMGRYELVDELGRGGMGVVYRAWDPELGRQVALKVLLTGPSASAPARLRFLREARAAARLHHPGIVRVYDIGEHDGNAWFTMPLVGGPTLSARLKQGAVPSADAARWVAQLARALHHAHEQGLVHRDVKPANVLLEGGDAPMLTDFGLVRHVEADEAALTHESQLLGTPAYMSPEQVQGGAESVGPASDQYSLGVVLYELLAGVRPFQDTNPAVLLRRVLDEEPPPLPPSTPRSLVTIVERAMRRDPARRYPSCAALADDLDRVQRGEVVPVDGAVRSAQIRRALRRHRRPIGVAWRTALALVGLAGALLLGLRLRTSRMEDERAVAAQARWDALQGRLSELYASGRVEDADEQFQAFVAFEGNQGTPALAQAWRGLGALRAAHEDPEGGLDALANAWLLAEDRAAQIEILMAMAEAQHAQGMWAALGAVLASLRALDAPTSEAVSGWGRDLALVRGDVDAALAATADPVDRATIDAITRVTPTEHRATAASALDLDGDGRVELLLARQGDLDLRVVHTTRPELPVRTIAAGVMPPGPCRLQTLPASAGQPPLLLLAWFDTQVLGWTGQGFTPLASLPEAISDVATGDVDRDGVPDRYVSTESDVLRLDPDGASVRAVSASAEHRATYVAAPGVEVADLDRDGHAELIVGTSAWRGYDVRSLEPSPEGLVITTRRRIGEVKALAEMRLTDGPAIAVLKTADPRVATNRGLFRTGERQGEPMGVHVLVRTPQGFDRRALLPLPTPAALPGTQPVVEHGAREHALKVGDLNGDGLDDLVLGYDGRWMVVFVQHPDGRFTELSMAGYFPLALASVDADPALEIIAARADGERRVWVFGAGDQRAPGVPLDVATARARPTGMPPDLAGAWDRAEALVAIGRLRNAAERLEVLAALAQDPVVQAAGQRRAAELYADAGEHGRASALYFEAARGPGRGATALDASMASALEELDLAGALKAGQARLALGDPPAGLTDQVAELARAVARPVHSFDLRKELDPRWHVLTPTGISSQAGVGLDVLAAERAVLLELPVRWDGGPYRVEVDLEVTRVDWGGAIGLALGPTSGWTGTTDLWVASGGGGGVLEQGVYCRHGAAPFHVALPDGALTGHPLTLSQELDPARGRASCSVRGMPQLDGRRMSTSLDPLERPGDLVLRITSSAAYDSQATAILHGIRLRGLEPTGAPATSAQQVNRLLALDRGAEALEALRTTTGAAAGLARARALESLGRRREARAELMSALALDPELGGELGRVMRGSLDVFERELREHFGARFPLVLWGHCVEVLEMHLEDPPAQELLTHYFAGIENIDPASLADDAARGAVAEILTLRASVWRLAGRAGAALQDLDIADRMSDEVIAHARRYDLRLSAERTRGAIALERARLRLSRGEDELAMAALLRGLARAPSPVVFADRVVATPDLDALHTHPDWVRIVAARRVWPASPSP